LNDLPSLLPRLQLALLLLGRKENEAEQPAQGRDRSPSFSLNIKLFLDEHLYTKTGLYIPPSLLPRSTKQGLACGGSVEFLLPSKERGESNVAELEKLTFRSSISPFR